MKLAVAIALVLEGASIVRGAPVDTPSSPKHAATTAKELDFDAILKLRPRYFLHLMRPDAMQEFKWDVKERSRWIHYDKKPHYVEKRLDSMQAYIRHVQREQYSRYGGDSLRELAMSGFAEPNRRLTKAFNTFTERQEKKQAAALAATVAEKETSGVSSSILGKLKAFF